MNPLSSHSIRVLETFKSGLLSNASDAVSHKTGMDGPGKGSGEKTAVVALRPSDGKEEKWVMRGARTRNRPWQQMCRRGGRW